jgi:hypothetical protein
MVQSLAIFNKIPFTSKEQMVERMSSRLDSTRIEDDSEVILVVAMVEGLAVAVAVLGDDKQELMTEAMISKILLPSKPLEIFSKFDNSFSIRRNFRRELIISFVKPMGEEEEKVVLVVE